MAVLFYENGYDQVGLPGRNADTISYRFPAGDAPVCTVSGEKSGMVNYFTSTLAGRFSVAEAVHYHLQNGMEITFQVKVDQLQRTVFGTSGTAEVQLNMLVSGAIVYPPSGLHSRGNSVNLLGRKGLSVHENMIGGNIVIPDILQGMNNSVTVRYHIPVESQSGQFLMTWSTYVGAFDTDELLAVCDLPDGGVVVCGRTMSMNFPGADNNDSLAGSYDMVIFRMDSMGQIIWTTLYGGLYYESANAMMVIDSAIYVAGSSNGNDAPMINAFQDSTAGSYDAIILKLDFNGSILQSSYYGGAGAEQAYGIAMDQSGNIVVGGSSTSSSIPMSSLGYQTAGAGAVDVFVASFDTAFAPQWSTFYGGGSSEDVHQLTVTPLNKIVMIGASFSLNFPCSPNAIQSGKLGVCDAYYIVFSAAGAREYATYYGGSSNEDCFGVAGDANGNIYLAGHTASIDFNIAGTTIQSNFSGVNDAWIAKFDSTGLPLFSSFYGGAMDEKTWGMQLRGSSLYVAGSTQSSDLMMNVTSPQDSMYGGIDGWILKLDTSGNYITSTYLGGSGGDEIYALTVNPDTMVTCVGSTYSTNFPVTQTAYQSTYVASGDGLVARYKLSEVLFSSAVPYPPAGEVSTLTVFPNPVNGTSFMVQSEFDVEHYFITDLQGRVVAETKSAPTRLFEFNIEFLSSGIYVVGVESVSGEREFQQLIIR